MGEEVVISGVGGHFPESDNLKEYGEKLLRNLHLISDTAGELQPKYDAAMAATFKPDPEATLNKETLKSGKMRYGDKFDNTFFGMHSRLAAATDSITRHVLESTMEAVVDAGLNPSDLHGTNTAVFMGYHCSESESNFIRESADGFGIMGLNSAMTANRVSYWLDLKGTSFTHNTQLVSGMQGLDMAFRALKRGECDRAIVGAASLSYLAELAVHYDDLGWLSPSGSCKPFDRAGEWLVRQTTTIADGGVRSEAVVVMLLERRSTAQRAYAEVVHAASALCSELSRSQLPQLERRVISHMLNTFYYEAGVRPDDIQYLEADGWGVDHVDESEIGALDDVIASRRSEPLLIGSVKGNIGQTEAASGLSAICKVLIAMESGTIPATINHVEPHSSLPALRSGRMRVVTENTPLKDGLVAVNNIGIGGMVGHVLLRPNKKAKVAPTLPPRGEQILAPMPNLLLMSGRTPEGLEEVMKQAEQCANDPEYVHLVHGAFAHHIFGHMYRGFSITPREDQQPAQIKGKNQLVTSVTFVPQFYTGQKRPIWFIYSGMGSQWSGMGEDLLRIPVFAAAIERCHAALVPLGIDLKHIITTKDPKIYDNILHSFVGIAAVQVGLTDVLRAVGIEPTGIIGHSVGELGCAYADGCITAEQMMLAAHARGQASNETELIPGMMAAVGMGYKDIKDMVPEAIEVACHNSATSCTLSGPTADLERFVAELKAKGVFARTVNVSNIAYHSRYIKPAAPRLLELLKGVILEPKARSARWVSTSVKPDEHQTPAAQIASAEYFTNNLLSSVYFEEGCASIEKDALAIEIAPHGLLQAILKRSLSTDAVNIPMTKRDLPGTMMVLESLGRMYMEGLNPQVARLYPKVETPVSRGTVPLSPLATWDHRDTWPVAFLKAPSDFGPRTELHLPLALTTYELARLKDCSWNGHTVLTPATALNLIHIIVSSYAVEGMPIVFESVVFYDPIEVPEEGSDELYAFVQRGSGHFEVSVQGRLLATGRARPMSEQDYKDYQAKNKDKPPATVPREERVAYDSETVYEELGRRGMQCSGPLRPLMRLQVGARAVLGSAAESDDMGVQLEAVLQVIMLHRSEGRHELHAPKRIQKIFIEPGVALPPGSEQTLHYDLARRSITLSTSSGRVEVANVETRAVPLAPTFPPVLVQAKAFLPYGVPDVVQDLVHLACVSLQVANYQSRAPILVTAVQGAAAAASGPLLDAVRQAAEQQLPDLHVKVTLGGAVDSAVLLVSSARDLALGLAAVRRQRGLLLAEVPAGFTPPPDLHPLLSYDQGRARHVLFKHAVQVHAAAEVLHVMEDSDVPVERLALCQGAVVYMVFRGVAAQRVPGVVRTVHAAPGGNRAHCVFLQDSTAPPFRPDAAPYAAQLALGLRVNVLQAGRWGGIFRLHVANMGGGGGCARLSRRRQLAMEGVQLQCLGVNPYNDEAEDAPTAVGLLDYVARSADGQRIMGVCSSSAGPLIPDPVLAWPVPQAWSEEDACTVPLAYATAVCALHEHLRARAGERALVVGGSTALGQAAVALLLAAGCHVIATVRDERERDELLERLPHAQPRLEVLLGSSDTYCGQLRLRYKGARCIDLALVQGGSRELQNVMSILNKYGRTVHVGGDQTLIGNALGMQTFILSTSLYSLAWNWPLTARPELKTRVRDAIFTAIQQGAVRPLPRSTAPAQALQESQRRVVEGAGKVVLSVRSEPVPAAAAGAPLLDPCRSCLVLGGSGPRAVSVAEWLLSSGARDVSVSLTGRAAGSAWLSRRLAMLAAHYGASVRALPPPPPPPGADLTQMARSAAQAAPLGLALALEQQPGRVRALDAATRLHGCTLAVLAAHGYQQQELHELDDAVRCRREQGYPGVLASLGDLPADVRILSLQEVLRTATRAGLHAVDVVQFLPDEEDDSDSANAALPSLLPSSLEALRRLGLSLSGRVAPRVLPSLLGGAVDRRNKEVPPVFLVAGVSDSPQRELGPMARYMVATAVVVAVPDSATTVQEGAAAVVDAILRAQARGPYTLVGRGWGGCVALEAASMLIASQGCHVSVFLVDASLEALQAAIKPLLNHPNGLQPALLKYLLELDRE
ncbi:Fatty acid synthase, partial [Frankliniella fusca]